MHGQGMSLADAIRQLGVRVSSRSISMDGSPVGRDVDPSGLGQLQTSIRHLPYRGAQMGNPRVPASKVGTLRGPHQYSGSWRAGPTYAAHFVIVSQPRGGPSGSDAVGFAASKHGGPDDPPILVGEGQRGPVETEPLMKLVDPGVEGIRLSRGGSKDGSGTMHQQESQVLAAAFGDAEEHGALSAGVLAWEEPHPGGEVAPVFELGAIANGGDDGGGGGGFGPDTLDAGDPLAVLRRAEDAPDLLVEVGGPAIQVPEQVMELADCLAGQGGQFVLLIDEDFGDHPTRTGDVLGEGDTANEHEAVDLANHGGAVVDHALPGPVQGLDVPLLDGLLRQEAHMRLPGLDQFTRESLGIRVRRKLSLSDVIDVLTDLFILRGIPASIRSDDGPEFVTGAVRQWIDAVGIRTAFTGPGWPWENGYIESFNAPLCDELLDREVFYIPKEAEVLIGSWRRHFNGIRPHSSLGYRPPAPETNVTLSWMAGGASRSRAPGLAEKPSMH